MVQFFGRTPQRPRQDRPGFWESFKVGAGQGLGQAIGGALPGALIGLGAERIKEEFPGAQAELARTKASTGLLGKQSDYYGTMTEDTQAQMGREADADKFLMDQSAPPAPPAVSSPPPNQFRQERRGFDPGKPKAVGGGFGPLGAMNRAVGASAMGASPQGPFTPAKAAVELEPIDARPGAGLWDEAAKDLAKMPGEMASLRKQAGAPRGVRVLGGPVAEPPADVALAPIDDRLKPLDWDNGRQVYAGPAKVTDLPTPPRPPVRGPVGEGPPMPSVPNVTTPKPQGQMRGTDTGAPPSPLAVQPTPAQMLARNPALVPTGGRRGRNPFVEYGRLGEPKGEDPRITVAKINAATRLADRQMQLASRRGAGKGGMSQQQTEGWKRVKLANDNATAAYNRGDYEGANSWANYAWEATVALDPAGAQALMKSTSTTEMLGPGDEPLRESPKTVLTKPQMGVSGYGAGPGREASAKARLATLEQQAGTQADRSALAAIRLKADQGLPFEADLADYEARRGSVAPATGGVVKTY